MAATRLSRLPRRHRLGLCQYSGFAFGCGPPTFDSGSGVGGGGAEGGGAGH